MGVGGLLFLVSDGFLAVRPFQHNQHGIGNLCGITYGAGQMLIVHGAIAGMWSRTDRSPFGFDGRAKREYNFAHPGSDQAKDPPPKPGPCQLR